nr:sulfur reduction protein DsrS [Thioalbus denitrificans]
MELSPEDNLRLNVLLAQQLQAVRIDESSMTLYGLAETGEAKVKLNPNCRDELYVRRVRELLSGQVLGSPEGYPVFLRRWTRMGQISGVRLEDMLKLGEPEAVVAVACSPNLSDELARRVWWAYPDAEVARRMLACPAVAAGSMGPELAGYLVEFLPFEEDPALVMESVRLVLQPGLINDAQVELLWSRGKRKNAYLVGFLATTPDNLPEAAAPREPGEAGAALESLAEAGNPYAAALQRVFSGPGQAFLDTAETVIRKPPNQEVVLGLFEAIAGYFESIAPARPVGGDMDALAQTAAALAGGRADPGQEGWPEGLAAFRAALPGLEAELEALLVLARLGEPVLRSIFAGTDAIGSLMRRKLEPVTGPVLEHLRVLRGRAQAPVGLERS